MAMRCYFCGREQGPNAPGFCLSCGRPLTATPASELFGRRYILNRLDDLARGGVLDADSAERVRRAMLRELGEAPTPEPAAPVVPSPVDAVPAVESRPVPSVRPAVTAAVRERPAAPSPIESLFTPERAPSLLLYLGANKLSPSALTDRNVEATLDAFRSSGAFGVLHGHTDAVERIVVETPSCCSPCASSTSAEATPPVRAARPEMTWTTLTRPPTSSAQNPPESLVKVDLSGEAGGKPVFLKGEIGAEQDPHDVNLDLWGNDLPLDETLLAALPEAPRHAAGNFRPTGRVDVRVFIRRPRGKDDFDTRFLIHLHDGTVCYRVFPLPLRDVTVTLDVRPDRWKFLDFTG